MKRRDIQHELAARSTHGFSREAGRLNRLAVEVDRAHHESGRSPLAARYRLALHSSRLTPDA